MTDYENQTIDESMKTVLEVNFGLTDGDIYSTLKQNHRLTTDDKKLAKIKEKIIDEIEKLIDKEFPLDDRIIELSDEIENNEIAEKYKIAEQEREQEINWKND